MTRKTGTGLLDRRRSRRKISSRNTTSRSTKFLGIVAVAPVVILCFALLAVPLARSIRDGFFDLQPALGRDEFIGFRGYVDLLMDELFLKVVANSVIWTASVVALQFAVGLFGAIVLERRFRGRWLARTIVIIPWAIPGVVAAMVWRLIYNPQLGFVQILTNPFGLEAPDVLGTPGYSLWGVVFAAVWKGSPFWMLICLAALQAVPMDQVEAARLDGAGAIRVFWHVKLPVMAPVLRIGAILTAIWTFNYFEMVYVMTRGGPLDSSHIFPTVIYEQAFRALDLGGAARLAGASIVILALLAYFFIREIRNSEDLK